MDSDKYLITELDVAWTQQYRAIIFNRRRQIVLSEVDHLVYHGPWLELLKLPVQNPISNQIELVEFYPLCFHPNECENDYKTFGCTVHAACWDLLQHVLGETISTRFQLAKVTRMLRRHIYNDFRFFVRCHDCFSTWIPRNRGNWSDDVISEYCDPRDIPELDRLYYSCVKRRMHDKFSDRMREITLLENLYESLPLEIKFIVTEFLVGGPVSKTEDVVKTLCCYWQAQFFTLYPAIQVDAHKHQPDKIDWQMLSYQVKLLLSSKKTLPRGWENRQRILKLLRCTTIAYFRMRNIKPTPTQLLIFDSQ